MRLIRILSVFSVLAVLISSCVCDILSEKYEAYPIKVELELQKIYSDVKSSFDDGIEDKITDVNIFVYHDGSLLEEYSGYFSDASSVMMSFPYGKDGFNIYMVGNVGKLSAPESEDDICDLAYVADSYDDFKTCGFPIANAFYDYRKGTRTVFALKRLAGRYDLRFSPSAADAKYTVKDVRLLHCALDVYPFGNGTKAKLFTAENVYGQEASADMLTEDDIERLNNGETVSLYFMENLQGNLLPDNKDRTKKIPSSLEEGVAACCTYLEITADIETPSAKYEDGRYRFYLGQDETSDFSVVRNTLYDVTLDFTQNMVNEEEWRIEVDEPEVKTMTTSKDVAHVVQGIDDFILIYGPKVEIDPENSVENDSGNCGYWLSDVIEVGGVECQKLVFTTNQTISGTYAWGTNYSSQIPEYKITLQTEERYNGEPLAKKEVYVNIHTKLFPVLIRMGTNGYSSPYQLEVISDAPVQLDLNVSATLRADVGNTGTVSTYTSAGTAWGQTSEGWQKSYARFTGLVNSGLAKSVYFKTMDVTISGKVNECSDLTTLYMKDEGKLHFGPDSYPQSSSGNISGSNRLYMYSTGSDGALVYCVYESGQSGRLLYYKPNHTHGFGVLYFDESDYEAIGGSYLPVYVANGQHICFSPYEIYNDEPKYLDDSGRVGFMFKTYPPGRDVFYPNGARWGNSSELSPDNEGKFGYIGAHMKQFLGNIKSWNVYSAYECDFFMSVNGCTAWPGGSNLSSGLILP